MMSLKNVTKDVTKEQNAELIWKCYKAIAKVHSFAHVTNQ